MRIIKCENYAAMSIIAGKIIADIVAKNRKAVLGLATGSSPVGVYEYLINKYKKGVLDFKEIKAVNLDEYKGISKTNPHSYYYYMHDKLFKHINISNDACFIPDGTNPDEEAECSAYERKVASLGYADIQLLGIGRNGHIGFNEPSDEFPEETHAVCLAESTIEANKRFFDKAEDVPTKAYTMGIGTIMKAKEILIIASGLDKAEAVRNAFFGEVTPLVPASILQKHPNVILVCDREAFSLCENKCSDR